MATKKFRFDHADLPPALIRTVEGRSVVIITVPTLSGKKRFAFEDGDVIRTADPIAQAALEGWAPPRIPIRHRPKGGDAFVPVGYDHAEHAHKRPFAAVALNTTHKHEA